MFLLGRNPASAGRGIGDPDTRPSWPTSWHYLGAEPDGLVVRMTLQGAAAADKARGRADVPPGLDVGEGRGRTAAAAFQSGLP